MRVKLGWVTRDLSSRGCCIPQHTGCAIKGENSTDLPLTDETMDFQIPQHVISFCSDYFVELGRKVSMSRIEAGWHPADPSRLYSWRNNHFFSCGTTPPLLFLTLVRGYIFYSFDVLLRIFFCLFLFICFCPFFLMFSEFFFIKDSLH